MNILDSFAYSDFLLRTHRYKYSYYSFKNEIAETVNFIGSSILIVSILVMGKSKESRKKWGIMILVGLLLVAGSYIVDHLLL